MRGRSNAAGIRGVSHWDLAGNGCCGFDTNILKVPESFLGVEIAISSNVLHHRGQRSLCGGMQSN